MALARLAVLWHCRPDRPYAASRPGFRSTRSRPDFSKFALAGFKRMFGVEGWMNLLKGLAKMIMSACDLDQLWPERGGRKPFSKPIDGAVLSDMSRLLFKCEACCRLGVIVASIILARMASWRATDVQAGDQEEYRQNEAIPPSGQIRQLRHERAQETHDGGSAHRHGGDHDPTHFAVALKYESGKMMRRSASPGVDAWRCAFAPWRRERCAVVENAPLARALHAATEIAIRCRPNTSRRWPGFIGYVMRLQGKLPARSN